MKWFYTLSIAYIILICLQPTQTFDVNIIAGSNQAVSSVQVSGQDVHIITSSEMLAFNLTNTNVMGFLTAYMNGRGPNDYAFSDPTRNGNTYSEYGFTQVQTNLTAVNASIVSFTTQPVILATKNYDNNSTDAATFTGDISQQVTNTVENSWSETNTITTTQTINYGISFLGSGGGSTSLSYSYAFQEGGSQSQAITVGTDTGFQVTVNPGQSIDASLSSTQGTMTVRVYFEATLSGQLYYHYDHRYDGHYFYAVDVNEVTNMIPVVTMTEDITVNFFAESQVLLQDPDTTETSVVSSAPVSDTVVDN